MLVDPGDVRKLDADRLRAGREAIGRLDEVTDVVVTSNRAETGVLADAYAGDAERSFADDAEAVFAALEPTWFVGHGVEQSVVVTAAGTDSVAVPSVSDPELTTSSGDHFNAGLGLARIADLSPAAAVVVGNAVAGYFVRTADQPSLADVRAFVDEYRRSRAVRTVSISTAAKTVSACYSRRTVTPSRSVPIRSGPERPCRPAGRPAMRRPRRFGAPSRRPRRLPTRSDAREERVAGPTVSTTSMSSASAYSRPVSPTRPRRPRRGRPAPGRSPGPGTRPPRPHTPRR